MLLLKNIVRKLEAQGIQVILFFPPLAFTPYAMISAAPEDYQFISQLPGELARAGLMAHDFTNPATINTHDCEFIDGFHGGEVTYARLLSALAESNALLGQFINHGQIAAALYKAAGLAMVPDPRITPRREIDFLPLGCRKGQGATGFRS